MEYVSYSKPRAQSWRWHVLDRPAALLLIRTIALGAEPSSTPFLGKLAELFSLLHLLAMQTPCRFISPAWHILVDRNRR